jgi:type IX secretion system PorP/SprF family membrane protein
MLKKPYVLFGLFLLLSLPIMAQQPAQYSMYMLNTFNWNPAAAGTDNALTATVGYRQQWAGLPGAPVSQYLLAQMPLSILRSGVGLKLENDGLGAQGNTAFALAYNYQMPVKNSIFSVGLAAGMSQYRLDGSVIRTPGGIYSGGVINHEDNLLSATSESGIAPTIEGGVYFKNPKFNAGIGIRNINSPTISLNQLQYKLKPAYFFTAEGNFQLSNKFSVHPSVFVRTDAVQLQLDAGVIMRYNDNIFGGATLRGYNSSSLDAVAIIGGFRLNQKFTIAYAYDLTLSSLQRVSNGSHEIVLHYRIKEGFGSIRPPKIIYNPRFL